MGDSAYPLKDWLLKPHSVNEQLTPVQQMFNEKFSQARIVVKHAFGRLKGRWQCLSKESKCDISFVKSMVVTCCALHNLCENRGETFNPSWNMPIDETEPVEADTPERDDGRTVRDGVL